MQKQIEVAVYMLDEDAQKFMLFQQYYEPFSIMVNRGVFSIRNGSASLHFDQEGILKNIERFDVLYDRRFSNTP